MKQHTYRFFELKLIHDVPVNEKICNLERDCIESKRDKVGITRHIMIHQVLYNAHVTLFIGQLHNIYVALGAS